MRRVPLGIAFAAASLLAAPLTREKVFSPYGVKVRGLLDKGTRSAAGAKIARKALAGTLTKRYP